MTTKFNELSTPLKILVVYGFIMMLIQITTFVVAFKIALIGY